MSLLTASILDADYLNIKSEIEIVDRAGVDMFTLDIMDGTFIPRITFGDYVVARIREMTNLPIDVHLMISNPINYIEKMYNAGADSITFHIEATEDPKAVIESIKSYNLLSGIALNPETPLENIFPFLENIELVNLLAVPTGHGGQHFQPETLNRVKKIKQKIVDLGEIVAVEVDGGVKSENIQAVAEAGADIITVGTGIYHASDHTKAVHELKNKIASVSGDDNKLRSLFAPRNLAANRSPEQVRKLRELRDALDIHPQTWDPIGQTNNS